MQTDGTKRQNDKKIIDSVLNLKNLLLWSDFAIPNIPGNRQLFTIFFWREGTLKRSEAFLPDKKLLTKFRNLEYLQRSGFRKPNFMDVFSTSSHIAAPLTLASDKGKNVRTSRLEEEVSELFDQFRVPLLRYLLAIGLNLHDGEEVIQEVFLSLFLHLRQDKPRTNLPGWLFRVAHNLGLRRRKKNSDSLKVLVSSETIVLEKQFDASFNPEEVLKSNQRQQRLLAIVRSLPERDRCCLYLRAEGLRYREIAEVLAISLGAVALSLGRSITRLSCADER